MPDSHHEYDRRIRPRECSIVDGAIRVTRRDVPGHNGESLGESSVGHWDHGTSWGGDGRADARNHSDLQAVKCTVLNLLATSAEDEPIAALQSHDVQIGACLAH